jgi:hypothetical protein
MINPKEYAIYLFNKGLKKCSFFNIEQSKQNSKDIVLMELLLIKEALHNVSNIDDLHVNEIKKTINFYQKVTQTIQDL